MREGMRGGREGIDEGHVREGKLLNVIKQGEETQKELNWAGQDSLDAASNDY